jgi:hypothetical protein
VLDDGCDDRRRAESRADAGEPVVCSQQYGLVRAGRQR